MFSKQWILKYYLRITKFFIIHSLFRNEQNIKWDSVLSKKTFIIQIKIHHTLCHGFSWSVITQPIFIDMNCINAMPSWCHEVLNISFTKITYNFFLNFHKELNESALVDSCNRFQAFRHVIIPVMWPCVITTGLFSFLLAYNDFAVTAMLLSQENQTMVPKIASFLGSTQQEGEVMSAVAAVVSTTVPLFVLVMFFQR